MGSDLRNRFNKSKKDNVPKELDKRIEETLKNIDVEAMKAKKTNKKKAYKKLIIAASMMLCVGGISAGAVIDGNFKETVYDGLGYTIDESEITTVGKTEIKNGIEFTIKEIVSDGYKIFMTYSVKGEGVENLKNNIWIDPKINGKMTFGGIGDNQNIVKDGTVEGVGFLNIRTIRDKENRLYKDKKIKKIELEITVGKEKFKYRVDEKEIRMEKEIKTYPINYKTQWGALTECIVTPLNIYLIGEKDDMAMERLEKEKFLKTEEFVLMDNAGIISRSTTSSIGSRGRETYIEFKNNFKDLSELTILENLNAIENNFKKIDLEIEDGKLKKQIKENNIEVLSVENKEGRSYIKYKMKQPNLTQLQIDWETHPYFNYQTNPISAEVSELVLTNGILEDGKYTFEYIDNGGYNLKEVGKIYSK